MDKPRNAIVVVIDRLGTGFAGPYGNTWIDSPTLNRLASESLIFEHAIADSICLDTSYRSYWQGLHSAVPPAGSSAIGSLPQQATAAGIETVLLTDSPEVVALPLAMDFSTGTRLDQDLQPGTAASLDETRSGQLFAAAIDELAGRSGPYCLWLHASAMNTAWDAPYDWRESLADDEDPAPPKLVTAPNYPVGKDADPDELLGLAQAYGGEIAALDRILEAFLEALGKLPAADETLLVLTSPRGFAMGEHGYVGACGDKLFGEVVQIPLLLRFPDGRLASRRCSSLVQPHDLCRTLHDWFGLATSESIWGTSLLDPNRVDRKRCSVTVSEAERAIRTPLWSLRSVPPEPPQLYAKPEDRWDANEVADRCPDVVAELAEALDAFCEQAKSTCLPCVPQLSDELLIEMS